MTCSPEGIILLGDTGMSLALQACREACGGQGFLAANKIGPLKSDMDVDVTFEGDNTVMMQQVGAPAVSQQALWQSLPRLLKQAWTSRLRARIAIIWQVGPAQCRSRRCIRARQGHAICSAAVLAPQPLQGPC